MKVFFLKFIILSVVFFKLLDGGTLFQEALKDFRKRNYKSAEKKLRKYLEENPQDYLSHYFLGITLY